jgi:CDP-paratose 2-epimerase
VTGHAIVTRRPVLVTGGAGFIGCNLADRLASEGHDVLVLDNLARAGSEVNLAWLRARHPKLVSCAVVDLRDADAVALATRDASCVFHLAAQVAVTGSLADPMADFEVNVRGTLLVLDALRRRPEPVPLIFASTNKVYGDLSEIPLVLDDGAWAPRDHILRARGLAEDQPLFFYTPYGCSKGAADQYVLDWSRSFGVPTTVLRMSCIYGVRQRGTEDQGWVAHFLRQAMEGGDLTIYGDGRQVRDVLFVDDAVAAYLAAWQRIGAVSGRAFNLGGGPANAVSLLQLIAAVEKAIGRRVGVRFVPWRQGDQRWFVANITAARQALGLNMPLPWREGLSRLFAWCLQDGGMAAA